MKKRTLSILLLASCLAMLVIAVPQTTPVSALKMEYFPLSPGSSLIYNSTSTEGDWMTKRYVAEDWEFLGGPYGVFTVLWSEAHMLPGETDYTWINHMWLSKTTDTLVWWGFEDESAKVIAYQGLDYVTEPVVVGSVHSGTTQCTLTLKATGTVMTNVPFSANYTIDAKETVTVPAGTFVDCIKIHEEELTPDGSVSFWVWYAPGVGAVQYYYPQQNDRWDVLFQYDVNTENDPWDTWFMPQVPTILTIATIGIVMLVVVLILFIIRRKRSV